MYWLSLLLIVSGVGWGSSLPSSDDAASIRRQQVMMYELHRQRQRRRRRRVGNSARIFGPGHRRQRHHSVFSMFNLTCFFYAQPLNHFELPRTTNLDDANATFRQRYCISNAFVMDNINNNNNATAPAPIFFYTGNESPLEEYVEHTGLLWELAEQFHAQVVFAEHRYEGKSLPGGGNPYFMPHHCMAFSSSLQAITDYARLIRNVLLRERDNSRSFRRRPVIVFGGSYGGMLSAWMRMRYPQWVTGAIAGSAPIWGFPNLAQKMDAASSVIRHGLQQPYPPNASASKDEENHCAENLLASFSLIDILARNATGRAFLTQIFELCDLLDGYDSSDVDDAKKEETAAPSSLAGRRLLAWLQTPWFDMAEASFPYPSSYIPYALRHLNVTLPAWPLQHACWKTGLHRNYGIQLIGNLSNVTYDVQFHHNPRGDDMDNDEITAVPTIHVDWDQAADSGHTSIAEWVTLPAISHLLSSVKRAVAVWYNMTHNETCVDISQPAPNLFLEEEKNKVENSGRRRKQTNTAKVERSSTKAGYPEGGENGFSHHHYNEANNNGNHTQLCQERMRQGSWGALCCNDDMNLIMTYTQGMGNDVFWPPSVPRSLQTYQDFVSYFGLEESVDPYCQDPNDDFGFPKHADPWSSWLDLQYASGQVWNTASNIVFSNGLLDPWSAAGVYLPLDNNDPIVPGLILQKGPSGMAALILEYGGHHADLMFSDPVHDPQSFTVAREIESSYIESWIDEFWKQQNNGNNKKNESFGHVDLNNFAAS